MRVGFFLEHQVPTNGGGFTFQTAIFEALKFAETQHKFYFFFRKINAKAIRETVDVLWFITPHYELIDEVPYIYTVWDLQHRIQPFFPEVSAKGEWLAREQLNCVALRRAAYVITGTETGKKEITCFYDIPEKRVRVINLPAPNPKSQCREKDNRTLLATHNIKYPYLFYPAQFWPHKNHVRILQAVKVLRDLHQVPFSVVFTGSDKGNEEYIKNLADEMSLTEDIHFLGFVSQEILDCLYSHAFALIFPSFFGPDNLPPLEAFSWGCPVIASRIAGADEQLGDAALLFDPQSEYELISAILQLYKLSGLRQDLVARGLARNQQIGSADNYVNKIIAVLDEFEPVRQCWSIYKG